MLDFATKGFLMDTKQLSYKDSLNLPKTSFPITYDHAIQDEQLRSIWNKEQLDSKASRLHHGKDSFILHDGPPYANGHIHMGHALNKIMKDIIIKSARMMGKYAPFIPGWDCHGLPIELKVVEQEKEKSSALHDTAHFLKACAAYAQQWIEIQQKEFKQIGVLADWEHRYVTMSPEYVSSILRSLATFVRKGFIERSLKSVPWCFHCKTVLAHAEIEYKDRKDPSVFVLFPLDTPSKISLSLDLDVPIAFLAWTTTPWTLPLNRALIVKPDTLYSVGMLEGEETALIIGKECVARLEKKTGKKFEEVAAIPSSQLTSLRACHPFDDITVPVIEDDMVGLEEGTAVVHCAPGCGAEDYLVGLKHGIEIFSPLGPDGTYLEGVTPQEMTGISIVEGQGYVIRHLAQKNILLHKENINHSYPHCWRCKQGLMFRATDQWFCSLKKEGFAQQVAQGIEQISFFPESGKNRFQSLVLNRAEWCISRQRRWGVPIPAFIFARTGEAVLSPDVIERVADLIKTKGTLFWQNASLEELEREGVIPEEVLLLARCPKTNELLLEKETDILDVWFDSGVSHTAACVDKMGYSLPVDMYLEGSDQHRAWFQSSFLASMIVHDKAPMKSIVTHGFVVDEQRHKMSKSVGNVISPSQVIEKYGVDVLRMWVASCDYEKDIVISHTVLSNVAEVFRKIRNTARFLLSNLYDFSFDKDGIPVRSLSLLDKQALWSLWHVAHDVQKAYGSYNLNGAYQLIHTYCVHELSTGYFDMVKDRLYTEKADGSKRRACQTVLYYILDTLTRLAAPILSFTADHIFKTYQGAEHSVHLEQFNFPPYIIEEEIKEMLLPYQEIPQAGSILPLATIAELEGVWHASWNTLAQIRSEIYKKIETLRQEGMVKQSLECCVTLHIKKTELTKAYYTLVSSISDERVSLFKEFLIVSQAIIQETCQDLSATTLPWLFCRVEKAYGKKCPRCWQYDTVPENQELCSRCIQVCNE